jgi:hypothetical protein
MGYQAGKECNTKNNKMFFQTYAKFWYILSMQWVILCFEISNWSYDCRHLEGFTRKWDLDGFMQLLSTNL